MCQGYVRVLLTYAQYAIAIELHQVLTIFHKSGRQRRQMQNVSVAVVVGCTVVGIGVDNRGRSSGSKQLFEDVCRGGR